MGRALADAGLPWVMTVALASLGCAVGVRPGGGRAGRRLVSVRRVVDADGVWDADGPGWAACYGLLGVDGFGHGLALLDRARDVGDGLVGTNGADHRFDRVCRLPVFRCAEPVASPPRRGRASEEVEQAACGRDSDSRGRLPQARASTQEPVHSRPCPARISNATNPHPELPYRPLRNLAATFSLHPACCPPQANEGDPAASVAC
jgi:hypothetical protein